MTNRSDRFRVVHPHRWGLLPMACGFMIITIAGTQLAGSGVPVAQGLRTAIMNGTPMGWSLILAAVLIAAGSYYYVFTPWYLTGSTTDETRAKGRHDTERNDRTPREPDADRPTIH